LRVRDIFRIFAEESPVYKWKFFSESANLAREAGRGGRRVSKVMARPGGPQPRAGVRPTHPGVVFASFGCCQPREKMDDKVRTVLGK